MRIPLRISSTAIFLLSVLAPAGLLSQSGFHGDLTSKYGDSKNNYNFSESLLNGFYSRDALQAWFQMEYSQPPELGAPFQGVRKLRLNYTTDLMELAVGDIYQIWGRGLMLNQIDDQLIDLDNGLRGLAATLHRGPVTGQILNGKAVLSKRSVEVAGFSDRRSNYRTKHQVFGTDWQIDGGQYSLAASFLQSRENHILGIFQDDSVALVHRLHGIRGQVYASWLDGYIEYVDKTVHALDPFSQKSSLVNHGYGLYWNLNVYPGAWSLSVDFKDYRFIELDPFQRWNTVSNYGGTIDFQNPPTVFREHTSVLLSRLTHQMDMNDELGYQIEISGPVLPNQTWLLNVAASSRHSEWLTVMNGFLYDWEAQPLRSGWPSDQPAASPFRELYTEWEGYLFRDRLHYRLGYGWTEDIPTVYINMPGDTSQLNYEYKQALTVPAFLGFDLTERNSIEVKWEFQTLWQGSKMVTDTLGNRTVSTHSVFYKTDTIPAPYQHNRFVSLGFSHSPGWAIALLIDAVDAEEPPFHTSAENPLEKFMSHLIPIDRKWVALEVVLNLNPRNRLTLLYGSQKGGLVCSNGVCRYVGAFDDGFKLTLTSIF